MSFFRFSDIPQRICARKITKVNAFNTRNSAGKPQDHKILLLQASVDDLPVKLTVSDRATGKCNDRILEGKHQNQVRETILKLESSITVYHQARRKLSDSPSKQPGLRAVSVYNWMNVSHSLLTNVTLHCQTALRLFLHWSCCIGEGT